MRRDSNRRGIGPRVFPWRTCGMVLATLAMGPGCESERSPSSSLPRSDSYQTINGVSGTVDRAGGRVGEEGRASVDVPAGAVDELVEIRIGEVAGIEPNLQHRASRAALQRVRNGLDSRLRRHIREVRALHHGR
jgi:hypothetical protein